MYNYKRDVFNKSDSKKEKLKIKLHSGKFKQNLNQNTAILISPEL